MGIFYSKRKRDLIPEMPSVPTTPQPPNLMEEENIDDEILHKLRKQLYNDSSTFILNNLLLSVQFFENYDKEIADLRISNVSRKENKINLELSEQQKHCLIPDTLHELIDKKVRFQAMHGESKYYSEALHVQRILIAYDNVEVHNPSETSEYSSPLDGPIYRCVTESADVDGYIEIKLKEIEIKRKQNEKLNTDQTSSPVPEIIRHFSFSDKDIYDFKSKAKEELLSNDNDDVFLPKYKKKTAPRIVIPNTTGIKINNLPGESKEGGNSKRLTLPTVLLNKPQTQSEYSYNKITNHYALKPLRKKQSPNDIITSTNLPTTCITSVHVQVFDDNLYEDEKTLRAKFTSQKEYNRYVALRKKVELFEKVCYLNSVAFKQYFGDIFPYHISKPLGFEFQDVENAMMQDATVYLDVIENGHIVNYEIIPTLTSSWPDDAFEWTQRVRPIVQDVRTKTAYRWPTQGMINRIKTLPCHIYPIGFTPKRGSNSNNDLEWRLAFPAAERFLESHLFHAQVRCYLFMLALYKTFMEQKQSKLGLTADHIRTHLFWECEKNYVRWPDTRLGEKLKLFLDHLRQRLSDEKLPDYFIPSRNLFENIPSEKLSRANYMITQILENPVMYTLRALRNLKYVHKKFYPNFNYKQLYLIMTASNVLQLINPNIQWSKPNDTDEAYDSDSDNNDMPIDAVTRWYQEAHRRIQMDKEHKKIVQETQRRGSVDSINVEIMPVQSMDIIRRMLILKHFIMHFIEMAKCSNIFDATSQGLMYTDHAKNLTVLLSEMESGKEDAAEFIVQIRKIENLLKISVSKEQLPKIPAKNIQLYNQGHLRRDPFRKLIGSDFNSENISSSAKSSNYANIDKLSSNVITKDIELPKSNQKKVKLRESCTEEILENNSYSDNSKIEIKVDMHHEPQKIILESIRLEKIESTDL